MTVQVGGESLFGASVLLLACLVVCAVYAGIRCARGATVAEATAALGFRWGRPADYAVALGLAVVSLALVIGALALVPTADPRTLAVVAGPFPTGLVAATTLAQTLAEELLFRGVIAGVLVRRFGFAVGNTAQAVVFLLPHLLLLAVDAGLWPAVVVQLLAGWLLGWLRHRSGSVLPCWLVHAAGNLVAPVVLAVWL